MKQTSVEEQDHTGRRESFKLPMSKIRNLENEMENLDDAFSLIKINQTRGNLPERLMAEVCKANQRCFIIGKGSWRRGFGVTLGICSTAPV